MKWREKLILLGISLLNVLLLSLGHAYDNKPLLIGAILVFLGLVIISNKAEFLPLMLFYLPWSPVLKISPDQYTFFTIVVPIVFFMVLLRGIKYKQKYEKKNIVLSLIFFSYTMIVKFLNCLPLQFAYLFFIMMIFFIPIYMKDYGRDISFEACVLFLTFGILSSCIAAQILMKHPHMLLYIDVYKWEQMGLVRLSGFYKDANYYSAQILVAISAMITVLGKTAKKTLIVLEIISICLLLYLGMKSVSKMFILCTGLIFFLWGLNLLIERRSISYKFAIISSAVIAAAVVFFSNIFAKEINFYLLRFGLVKDINSLSTGRSKLMATYIHYLLSNIDKLFFGIGLSQDQVQILLNTNNAHNTPIQMIYQVGIIGSLLLLLWWMGIYRDMANNNKMDFSGWVYFFIMVLAVFLPWMALDMLYFDEFFYYTLLLFLSKRYISKFPLQKPCLDFGLKEV